MTGMSMKPSSAAFAAAVSFLVMVITQVSASAVTNATVTGRVTDEQAAVVPNAQIQITAAETGARYSVLTNAAGIYTVPSLPIGAYTLQVTVAGFQTYVQTGIN